MIKFLFFSYPLKCLDSTRCFFLSAVRIIKFSALQCRKVWKRNAIKGPIGITRPRIERLLKLNYHHLDSEVTL
jgi:hypothetical protein